MSPSPFQNQNPNPPPVLPLRILSGYLSGSRMARRESWGIYPYADSPPMRSCRAAGSATDAAVDCSAPDRVSLDRGAPATEAKIRITRVWPWSGRFQPLPKPLPLPAGYWVF